MPFYTFIDDSGNESTHNLSISERDAFLEQNPKMRQKLTTPSFGDPHRLGIQKTSDGFNDLLKSMKKAHKGSTIKTR